jgi:hypothetical protein
MKNIVEGGKSADISKLIKTFLTNKSGPDMRPSKN